MLWNTRVRPRVGFQQSFQLGDHSFRYFYHRRWETWKTERAVEIPIAQEALRHAPADARVLEVGNVLTQYTTALPRSYVVVDKYERAPHVANLDVIAVAGTFDLILSISTLEHVGLDESPREWGKARAAVDHLRSLLAPGGQMLATWALAYNRDLDDALRAGALGESSVRYLERQTRSNTWAEVNADQAYVAKYGWPWICGNAIAVVTWTAP